MILGRTSPARSMPVRRLAAVAAALLLGWSPALAQSDQDGPAYPTTEFGEGETTATVTVDDISATISMETRPDIDTTSKVPVLTVKVGGVQVLEVAGVASGFDYPAADASIVEMDPANSRPEVYFTSYSGGAHCCSTVIVASETPSGWVAATVGSFDGGGDYLDDLDGDGEAEVATVDNRFLYTFDCYACSAAPLVVYSIRNGQAVDQSTAPQYRSAHERWLRELEDGMEASERWTSPGFLAGWVAENVRLGRGAEAFRQLEEHWNSADDEGEEVCRTGQDLDQCPRGEKVVLKFPERLKLFLDQNGYAF